MDDMLHIRQRVLEALRLAVCDVRAGDTDGAIYYTRWVDGVLFALEAQGEYEDTRCPTLAHLQRRSALVRRIILHAFPGP